MKKKLIYLMIGLTVALAVTAIALLFTGPRMWNQLSLVSYEAVPVMPPNDVVAFEKNNSIPSLKIVEADTANISRGRVYYGYYCIFCHGKNGKGDGPVGEGYHPRPADLTKNVKHYDIIRLYDSAFGGLHSPVLESIIKSEHKQYIVLYLKYGLNK